MTVSEIPLSPQPQVFSISLAGVIYQLTFQWCAPGACWCVGIADSSGAPILSGIPMVTGADLLEQFAYLGIGGAFIVQTDHDVDAVPTFANLGTAGRLYFESAA